MKINLKHIAVGLVLFFSGWKTVQMPTAFSISDEQCLACAPTNLACLREALYHEARGEPEKGIFYVLSVIDNRTKNAKFPANHCDVIRQPRQFSYNKNKPYQFDAKIENVLYRFCSGKHQALPENVLFYAKSNVKNYWTTKFKPYITIGNHTFYTLTPH